MPTIQVWLHEKDMKNLDDLRKIFAMYYKPDYPYTEKEYLPEEYIMKGTPPPHCRRPKLNNSFIVRLALEEALKSLREYFTKIDYVDPSAE